MNVHPFVADAHARGVRAPADLLAADRAMDEGPRLLLAAQEDLTGRVERHPFIEGCRRGRVSRAQLDAFLVQQARYSAHFTRYLCALMSNLETSDDVVRLAANLAEETGGEGGELPHSVLYARMLADLGLRVDAQPVHAQTRQLIDTMYMLCRQADPACGLGALCLGAEAIVPAVYAAIVEGFGHAGVAAGRLDFFLIHIECDDGHAQTMFDIMDRMVRERPERAVQIAAAGEMAVQARLRFFDRLLASH